MLRKPRLDPLKTTAFITTACLVTGWSLMCAGTSLANDETYSDSMGPEAAAVEGALLAPPEDNPLRLAGTVSEPTVDALVEHIRRLGTSEDRIGESRRLRLWVARSHLPRWDLGAVEHEDPLAQEEIEDIVGHCVLKLVRVRLEEHLGLASLKARRDARRRGASSEAAMAESPFIPRSWSLSPRAGVGHDPWLGGKLRWRRRGSARHLRDGALVLGFKSYLEHDETSALLEWRTDDLSLGLEHVWDSPESGDVTWLSLRWRI